MAKPTLQDPKVETTSKEAPFLKGTFIAVLFIGAFLIVSWVGVWGLFLNR
ncbi:cytochrome c oxidase subunit 2A [Pontibacillus litoralis]|uniref:Subunit I/II of b(O/a)3-type cytochrome C oxidase n=1 Tax=Pontibacillus litoralis JSM 072002 TaxID=1385512 RepID=A0A0A5G471_9BACI|nr:cytochrome c oxidase subunit 2A [Pontibacillus litoralis]KGX87916.1 subunit I/II of b(o/a)3-type cytochrome C oxidase [Pontibacillus litoralis JSM 072002]